MNSTAKTLEVEVEAISGDNRDDYSDSLRQRGTLTLTSGDSWTDFIEFRAGYYKRRTTKTHVVITSAYSGCEWLFRRV